MNKQPEGRKGQDGRGAPAWRGKGGNKGRPFRGGPKAPAGASDENMLEGRNAVTEALRSGREIDKIYFAQGTIGTLGHLVAQARKQGITAQEIDRRKLDAMSITGSHQGIIALCAAVPYRSVEDMLALARERGEDPLLVLCDGITDPHNLGAIIRTAEVAGAHGVIIPRRRSATLNSACAKAAAGALEYLPVAKVNNLPSVISRLKEEGIFLFAADMDGDRTLYEADWKGPAAIVIGSEGEGISALVKKECDYVVRIPQKGRISSLNASNAAAILLYEAVRQRMEQTRSEV